MTPLKVSIEGTFTSLPDSSLNILQENPGISPGKISLPFMSTEGEPIKPSLFASA